MNWYNGFTARYYVAKIDPPTWREIGRYELTAGQISKTGSALMESANLSLPFVPDPGETWIRVWLDARQESGGEKAALFTGLMQTPATKWNGRIGSCDAECYSVLKPAEDILLQRGWYALAGTNGAKEAADLLSVGPAPVEYDESAPNLSVTIIAEDGETNLSMAHRIVDAIGWQIRIDGSGKIRICQKAEGPTVMIDQIGNDVMEVDVTDTNDWYSCPNVFRALSGDMMAVARDDDENSPYSTVSRGREIWKEEKDCSLNDGEDIAEYALRRLKEEQSPGRQVSYTRRYLPDVYPGDIVQLNIPALKIMGDFRISEQRIELGYGGRTAEEAEEI